MPYTLNGFGTKYYGRRDWSDDGSYVTTLWVTALYIPVVPLGSYRVLPVGDAKNWVVHRTQSYRVLRVPLNWEQVWRIYMIGAPILFVIGWFIWTNTKEDRARDSFQGKLSAAGDQADRANQDRQRLRAPCLDWFNSQENLKKGFENIRTEMHGRCTPWITSQDNYMAKIDAYQHLAQQGLSGKLVEDSERSELDTAQGIWTIRRHQAEEAKQIATCMANLSQECYDGLPAVIDAIKKEDKAACSLLASLNEKCE